MQILKALTDTILATIADDALFYLRLADQTIQSGLTTCVQFNSGGSCTNGFHPIYYLLFYVFGMYSPDRLTGMLILVAAIALFTLVLSSTLVYRTVAANNNKVSAFIIMLIWIVISTPVVFSGMEVNLIISLLSVGLLTHSKQKTPTNEFFTSLLSLARTDFSVFYSLYKIFFDRKNLLVCFCTIGVSLLIFGIYGYTSVGDFRQVSSVAKSFTGTTRPVSGYLDFFHSDYLKNILLAIIIMFLISKINTRIFLQSSFFIFYYALFYFFHFNSHNWSWYAWPLLCSFLSLLPSVNLQKKYRHLLVYASLALVIFNYPLSLNSEKFFFKQADKIMEHINPGESAIVGDLVGYFAFKRNDIKIIHGEGLVLNFQELKQLNQDFNILIEKSRWIIATINEVSKLNDGGFHIQYAPKTVGKISQLVTCTKAVIIPKNTEAFYFFDSRYCRVL